MQMSERLVSANAAYKLAKRDALTAFNDEMDTIAIRQRDAAARYAAALVSAATARRNAMRDIGEEQCK